MFAAMSVHSVKGQEFFCDARYDLLSPLGQGAYGIVWWVLLARALHEAAARLTPGSRVPAARLAAACRGARWR